MGLTLAARRAGTNAASPATSSNTPATAAAVAGSVGLTPYRNEAIVLVSANAATSPTPMPSERRRQRRADDGTDDGALLGTERHAQPDLVRALRDGVAQHAIEPDGREHERDTANAPISVSCVLRFASSASSTSLIARTLDTGWSGSTAQMALRTVGASASGSPAVRTTSCRGRMNALVDLIERHVELGVRGNVQAHLPNVADDADDGHRFAGPPMLNRCPSGSSSGQ